jgi:hypothetical protein
MPKICPICKNQHCGAESNGYICTLAKDHTGVHKAYGSVGTLVFQWD